MNTSVYQNRKICEKAEFPFLGINVYSRQTDSRVDYCQSSLVVDMAGVQIGIIGAMLHRPSLLILDEPFNFLDPSSQSVIKHLLAEYNKETGATILVSSHNLNHTTDVCLRIALLENGVIIRDIDNTDRQAETELESYFNVNFAEEETTAE